MPKKPGLQGQPANASLTEIADEPHPHSLTNSEILFLYSLIYGGTYENTAGITPAMLTDNINSKLFDRFSDMVLVEDGGRVDIIEDYIEELKGIIGR